MKTYTMLLMAGLVLAGVSGAKGQDSAAKLQSYFVVPDCSKIKNIKDARENYALALMSDNNGVIESALAQIAFISLCMPDFCTEEMQSRVSSLAVVGRTTVIRYKAYLTGLAIESPSLFVQETAAKYENGEAFFSAISKRLQQTLLGYNDRKYVRSQ
jgi:hypothetical protein